MSKMKRTDRLRCPDCGWDDTFFIKKPYFPIAVMNCPECHSVFEVETELYRNYGKESEIRLQPVRTDGGDPERGAG